jgi:hypothetical protein
MTEEEEFEFRARRERERGATSVAPAASAEPTDGAAFGIFPKQRATPSKPETQQAMTRFAETTGEFLGLGTKEEPEFAPGQIATAGGVGAAGGAVAPRVLRTAGSVLSRIPTVPTRAAGAGLTALGTGLQQTSAARRAALGGGGFAGAETGGQIAALSGLPPILGAGPGAAVGMGQVPGRQLVSTLRGRPIQEAQAAVGAEAEAARRAGAQTLTAEERAAQQTAAAQRQAAETEGLALTERQAQATRAAEKSEAGKGRSLRELAGVRTLPEAGAFKPIPQTETQVGEYIRGQAKNFVDGIKAQRARVADANFTGAKTEAAQKEALGQFVDTQPIIGYLEGLQAKGGSGDYINSIRRLVEDIGGTRGFEGLEIIRRRVGDAAFGLPEEGYKAIGQQLAKDVYGQLANQMRQFSGSFGKYLDDYKRLSQPIEVYGTKVGKGLIETQDAAGRYFTKTADQIANDVFKSPEATKQFLDAVGGNQEIVTAAARRYFAGKLEGAAKPEAVDKLLKDNRELLRLPGMQPVRQDIESFKANLVTSERRAGAARGVAEESQARISGAVTNAIDSADKALATRLKDIQSAKTLFSDSVDALVAAKPGRAVQDFDRTVLPKIRDAEAKAGVKIIDENKLQELRQQLTQVDRVADKVQRTRLVVGALGTYLVGQTAVSTAGKVF